MGCPLRDCLAADRGDARLRWLRRRAGRPAGTGCVQEGRSVHASITRRGQTTTRAEGGVVPKRCQATFSDHRSRTRRRQQREPDRNTARTRISRMIDHGGRGDVRSVHAFWTQPVPAGLPARRATVSRRARAGPAAEGGGRRTATASSPTGAVDVRPFNTERAPNGRARSEPTCLSEFIRGK